MPEDNHGVGATASNLVCLDQASKGGVDIEQLEIAASHLGDEHPFRSARLTRETHKAGIVAGNVLENVNRGRAITTRRLPSLTGSGRRINAFTTLKIAVLTPTPRANVSTIATVKISDLRRSRIVNARSSHIGLRYRKLIRAQYQCE